MWTKVEEIGRHRLQEPFAFVNAQNAAFQGCSPFTSTEGPAKPPSFFAIPFSICYGSRMVNSHDHLNFSVQDFRRTNLWHTFMNHAQAIFHIPGRVERRDYCTPHLIFLVCNERLSMTISHTDRVIASSAREEFFDTTLLSSSVCLSWTRKEPHFYWQRVGPQTNK